MSLLSRRFGLPFDSVSPTTSVPTPRDSSFRRRFSVPETSQKLSHVHLYLLSCTLTHPVEHVSGSSLSDQGTTFLTWYTIFLFSDLHFDLLFCSRSSVCHHQPTFEVRHLLSIGDSIRVIRSLCRFTVKVSNTSLLRHRHDQTPLHSNLRPLLNPRFSLSQSPSVSLSVCLVRRGFGPCGYGPKGRDIGVLHV